MILAVVAAAAIPFAPPLDHPLRYRTIETRRVGDRTERFSLAQEARFARGGDGYVLTLTTVSYGTDGSAAERARLDATIRPTLNVPLRIRLDGDGVARGVIDGAVPWAATVAGMRALAAMSGADAARRAVIQALVALPPAQRDAQLLEAADDIVPLAGKRVAHRHDDQLRAQPGGAALLVAEDVDVSPTSGIVVARHRILRARAAGSATVVPIGESDVHIVGY